MSQWTQEDIDRLNAKRGASLPAHIPAKSKYRNVKTMIGSEKFDSKREANYWSELLLRFKSGEIDRLQRQVPFDLLCAVGDPNDGIAAVVSTYVADFVFYTTRDKVMHIVDAKGKRTALYSLKKKWLELQTGFIIEEV